jgi:signal transduction histidine kinase/CheY-like chemotaxis protein
MPMTEIVGRHCYEVSHQRTKPCYESGEECAVHDTFRKGKLSVSVHQHNDRNGNVIFVETKSYPLKDASGNVTSAIEIVNNITDRHLLEEQLFRAQKLESVGLLAGGIAHDFNNLLQGVFGNVSLAKLFTDKDGKAYRALEEAEKAFDLSRNLTKQLLTFSKGGEPVKKVLSLSSIVQDSVKFALSGSRVDYRISIDDNLWPVEADEGQISQVMQNIVLNASDAMPEGGTVKIDVNNLLIDKEGTLPLKTGRYVLVSIEDTGSGIPEHHIRKIFDPYFTTKQKGSGLGLATSYSIIKKHNGTLDVKSRLGAGSTFFIYLPASDGKASFERARGSSPLTGKGKILVMDDEKIIITVVSIMLETLGYDVDSAGDGKEAVEKFSNALKAGRPFDAVILDLTVRGGMGGKETIMKLIEIDPSARAIVSSGYSDDPILANYSDYGFKATLSKPYELHELSDKLHSLIYTNGG